MFLAEEEDAPIKGRSGNARMDRKKASQKWKEGIEVEYINISQ